MKATITAKHRHESGNPGHVYIEHQIRVQLISTEQSLSNAVLLNVTKDEFNRVAVGDTWTLSNDNKDSNAP